MVSPTQPAQHTLGRVFKLGLTVNSRTAVRKAAPDAVRADKMVMTSISRKAALQSPQGAQRPQFSILQHANREHGFMSM